ncbi:MAG: rod shape-determining protein [Candidatus Vogelbacteria bacterium CG10_big_fil_rev_8_21_14_0_10_45_14]|uniref:Cell shape-determining protein MreB n=1 Tax=Candidatus Vogelbacteria bacterium CG10_big_fil_rev_8_21_14_0_10_45_14 TaxID=1975042 RepID=A0A2H0RJP4_9BACT|nr:MAG: rod shape-determining protein [Candidatus Vogelbacteria bacterium CG10_big_fil_rev_8_21_14_0_10_45_14]
MGVLGNILSKIRPFHGNDIGIDLGTANTLVYVKGIGTVINEPSVVALNQKTGQVVGVGGDAKQMLGRTPAHIAAIRPLVDGVISDFEVTEEMIAYFVRKAEEKAGKRMGRPRVVIGVPSGVTNVERRAVKDATRSAGARIIYLMEEPMAAAIGIHLPVFLPVGNMIIDIGGGTTDIAVISLGGIVQSENLHVAGDKLNRDIINYVRDEFKILLGEKTAEEIKIAVGSAGKDNNGREAPVRGRDLVTGLPREVMLTSDDIKEATAPSFITLVEKVKAVLERTPPELIADIMKRGIFMVGGGALIEGLAEYLSDEIGIPVYVADDPLTAVLRGTSVVLEDIGKHKSAFIDHEDNTLSD